MWSTPRRIRAMPNRTPSARIFSRCPCSNRRRGLRVCTDRAWVLCTFRSDSRGRALLRGRDIRGRSARPALRKRSTECRRRRIFGCRVCAGSVRRRRGLHTARWRRESQRRRLKKFLSDKIFSCALFNRARFGRVNRKRVFFSISKGFGLSRRAARNYYMRIKFETDETARNKNPARRCRE